MSDASPDDGADNIIIIHEDNISNPKQQKAATEKQAPKKGTMAIGNISGLKKGTMAIGNVSGLKRSGMSRSNPKRAIITTAALEEEDSDAEEPKLRMAASTKVATTSKRSSNHEFNSLHTIQSEEFVLDRQISNNSIQRVDEITPLSGNHRKQSIPMSLPEHGVIAGEEISYIASVMEEPPPPPPTREDSIQFPLPASREYEIPLNVGSSSYQDIRFQGSQQDVKMEASQDIKFDASQQDITFDASQDIRFDASQDIRFDASSSSLHPANDNFFRRSSIAEMQFSDKDKLLQEPSQAFSTPQYITKKIRSQDFRRLSPKSKPASFHLASIDQLASDGPEPDRSNVRPASADDVMLKRPPSNLILSPSSAQIPSQLSTPPREKQPMKLGDFLQQNHDGNESDEPELAEFGDLPVNRGFLRLDGGSSSPVSYVTMLRT